jgi:AraC family transcriptional regulator
MSKTGRPLHVPVTLGSPRFRTLDTTSVRTTRAWFPAEAVLAWHSHDRPILAVMVAGGFETRIRGKRLGCGAGFAWTEPVGEPHSNHVGSLGALAVVIEPDWDREDTRIFEPLIGSIRLLQSAFVTTEAQRLLAEMGTADAFRPLAVESNAITLLALAARLDHHDGDGNRRPGWLARVREALHDDWRHHTLDSLAAIANVHPCHLAHVFRDRVGESIGAHLRRLRLNWAVGQLAATSRPISEIALAAGFSDQSHLTRLCRRQFGAPPARLRALICGEGRVAF